MYENERLPMCRPDVQKSSTPLAFGQWLCLAHESLQGYSKTIDTLHPHLPSSIHGLNRFQFYFLMADHEAHPTDTSARAIGHRKTLNPKMFVFLHLSLQSQSRNRILRAPA